MTAVDSDTARYASQDLYGLLHVTPDADPQLIQYGYRVAALKNHPDTGGSPERMQLLNKAKEILLDPQRRATYDRVRRPRTTNRSRSTSKDQRTRISQLERDVAERDRRLSQLELRAHDLERKTQELYAARVRLEPIEKRIR